MPEITVSAPQTQTMDGWPAISTTMTIEGRRHKIHVRAQRGPLTTTADPFLAAAVLPAMRLGHALRIDGVVSAGLMDNISRMQDMLCAWFPNGFQRIAVSPAAVKSGRSLAQNQTGCFFSGGIDSFYSALKHGTEIADLIFIHGYDIPLHLTELRQLVSQRLASAASELGHGLLEVETNVRSVLDPYTDWNLHGHGCALGVAALAVAPQFSRIYIGSTMTYSELQPHGSHPLFDPLWGHQDLELIHDGCEQSRWRKAERIISNPVVQRHLRVCWQVPRTEYNCGRCDGCLRVMLFLRATGMAQQCDAFPPLDLAATTLTIANDYRLRNYMDLLTVAKEHQQDPEVIAWLQTPIAQAQSRGIGAAPPSAAHMSEYHEIAGLKVDLRRARARLAHMEGSLSWRMTAPGRALGRFLHSRRD